MPFGRKARHVKAYQFGAEAPLEGVGALLEQHRLRTDYYNALVEMELHQREQRAALLVELARKYDELILEDFDLRGVTQLDRGAASPGTTTSG